MWNGPRRGDEGDIKRGYAIETTKTFEENHKIGEIYLFYQKNNQSIDFTENNRF